MSFRYVLSFPREAICCPGLLQASENFRNWLNSEDGTAALQTYLSKYPLKKIKQRAEKIAEQYEHPENLPQLIVDDTALNIFIAAFRKTYPHATESVGIPDGQTIH
jgi:hypothetical protein